MKLSELIKLLQCLPPNSDIGVTIQGIWQPIDFLSLHYTTNTNNDFQQPIASIHPLEFKELSQSSEAV